jgi:hypothetical protein
MVLRIEALFAAVAVVAGVGSAGIAIYDSRHLDLVAQPAPSTQVVVSGLPSAVPTLEPSAAPTPTPTATPIPASLFIRGVPYTVQSPYNQWGPNDPHQEYCEAAAVMMVGRYYRGDKFAGDRIPPADADAAMAQIVQWERQQFPGVLDLPLEKVGQTGKNFYNMTPATTDATLDNVKAALASGKPVLIPVMTHGGPGGGMIAPFYGAVNVYHIIVLTGYDGGSVYANDAGFSQGQNYKYDWSVLQAAIAAQQAKMGQGAIMLTFTPGS